MHDPANDELQEQFEPAGDWSVAVAIVATIVICIVAFIWIFIRLDPFLDDFVSSTDLTSPTVIDSASPVIANPTSPEREP